MPEPRPKSQTVAPISVGKRFAARPPAVAPRLPRLLPAASPALTCAAVEACRVLCHIARFARASLRDDAARTLAPRCGVNRCPAACPIRKPLPRSLAGLRFVARPPAVAPRLSRLSPASSPALPCTWRSKPAARRATSRASHTARSGLVVCDDAARTLAPRRNVQRCPRSVPNAQTALFILCLRERFATRPPALVARLFARPSGRCRCDALSLPCGAPHRAPLAPASTTRPALVRRAATSNEAHAACPVRKPRSYSLPANASLPAVRRGPASFSPGVEGHRRACGALSLPRIVPHCALREDAGHTLAPRGDVQRCPCRAPSLINRFPDSLPANTPLPGRSPWPYVFCPSPAASRGARRSNPAARLATSRASLAHRSGIAVCDHAPRTLAPRHEVQRCPCLRAQFATPLSRLSASKRFVVRPPVVAPRISRPSPAQSRCVPARATL